VPLADRLLSILNGLQNCGVLALRIQVRVGNNRGLLLLGGFDDGWGEVERRSNDFPVVVPEAAAKLDVWTAEEKAKAAAERRGQIKRFKKQQSA
jgi:hypothetical protein